MERERVIFFRAATKRTPKEVGEGGAERGKGWRERELSFSEQLLRELQTRWGRGRGGETEGVERERERVIFFRAATKRTPDRIKFAGPQTNNETHLTLPPFY